MTNRSLRLRDRWSSIFARYALHLLAASAVLLSSCQTACSKKTKVPVASSGPIRVVLLPFAVPASDKELQWAAMAAPALLAKVSRQMPEMVIIPFWEAMPSAIASAGATRSFTDESATAIANWAGARWAIMGEITPTKTGYSVAVDFIPARSGDVPFRYIKTRRMETMGLAFQSALRQWLSYVTTKRTPQLKKKEPGLQKLKTLGIALDREYGWFVEADPGNAQEAVEELTPSDMGFARILFNPTMYPALASAGK